MKNLVFLSFESQDHDKCVDIFKRPDGTFGFEEFRRDVEDQGAWQSMARYATQRFITESEALNEANKSVPWLKYEPTWQSYLAQSSRDVRGILSEK